MPAKRAIKYSKGQMVEIGNGKRQKPLVGEVIGVSTNWRYRSAYGRGGSIRQVRSRIINYNIHFLDRTEKWVEQDRILRAQPEPTQEELEARARKLFGDDYL